MRLPLSSLRLVCLLVACPFAVARPAAAQDKPNPRAPSLSMPVPLGIQRGTHLDLTLTGTNLAEPTALWTSFPAKVTIPTAQNNGKDNGKLLVQLDVPADAPLGFHALRLATKHGLSNLRLFCVDDLPAVAAADTNRARATPQPLTPPCVVTGRMDAEASHWYKVHANTGQRIAFDVLGRRLGSPFDPQVTLYDARTGHELPGGHCQDSPGCQSDPRLAHVFKQTGDYLVEVRDATYRGGPDFWYRLRVGDFPLATTPIPMAAKRGSKVKPGFAGPSVEGVIPIELTVPTDPQTPLIQVAPKSASGQHGWPVPLVLSDFEERVEQEPNDSRAQANRLTIPSGITGRFDRKGDVDHYVVAAKKGQRLVVDGHTVEVQSPTLLYLVVRDATGAELARSNPQAAPPLDQHVDFTAPADGDIEIEVQHLNYQGGPSESYRLTIAPYQPGFTLTASLDRYDAAQGQSASIPILLTARRDYPGPIEVSVAANHPGITGTVTIPANKAPVPNQPAATLTIQIAPDVPLGAYVLRLQGKGTIDSRTLLEPVSVRGPISQELANLPYPPMQFTSQLGFAVTPRPPFTLTARFDPAEALRGGQAGVTITATRSAGFDEEIALSAASLPANVAPALKNLPKGQNEVKAQLNVAANAALGQFPVSFVGKAKHEGKEFTVSTPPANLSVVLPFDLTLQGPVKLKAGEKARMKVQAKRKGGYAGPIVIEARNLPPKVTAEKLTLDAGKDTGEVTFVAAADAALGDKADVTLEGTAPAAANQQSKSAKFTVSVVK